MIPQMKRYLILLVAVLLPGVVQAADRPNIVVILTDDQGWGDLHVHGNTALSTPDIDRYGARRSAVRSFLCQPGLFADTRRIPNGGDITCAAECMTRRRVASGLIRTRR